MNEQQLRAEIIEYLYEQDYVFYGRVIPTKILCLMAAINDYSFSDEMKNCLPEFLPNDDDVEKYRN